MFLTTFVQNLVKYLQLATTHPSKENHLYQDIVRTEQLSREGTIWYAVNHGDSINLDRFIDKFDEECLKQRDHMGATPLHILCLRNFPDVAMDIIKRFPKRGLDVYCPDESSGLGKYTGENCLHIAIVQHNMVLTKFLVDTCGADLFGQEAVGKFFLPAEGGNRTVYYGGFPLSFAVACNKSDMVKYLVEQGADMTLKDTVNGNTAMHISILYDLPEMYTLLEELWKQKNYYGVFDEQLNKENQSSMTLAAATGNKRMFEHVMDTQKKELWQYGPITCNVYPLKEFDVLHTKHGDRYGALEYLVQHDHLDLMSSKHVLDLIDKKWNCFAKQVFYARFVRTVLFIQAIFFASLLPRLDCVGATYRETVVSSSVPAQVRLGCECLALLLATFKMYDKLIEIRFHGLITHFTNTGAAMIENIASTFCILTVYALCGLRLFHPLSTDEEDAILASLNIVAWMKLLWFFLIMSEEIGIFVIILRRMLISDLRAFSAISLVFLGGFSTAFHLLGVGSSDHLGTQVISMMAVILGDFEVSSYRSERFPRLATGLALLYISLLSLVLMNMLIAKMGDTYAKIVDQAEKRWNLERARLVIDIERSMSEKKKSSLEESKRYWVVGINEARLNDKYFRVEEDTKLWSSSQHLESDFVQ